MGTLIIGVSIRIPCLRMTIKITSKKNGEWIFGYNFGVEVFKIVKKGFKLGS